MKVFELLYIPDDGYYGPETIGIYATREAAEADAATLRPDFDVWNENKLRVFESQVFTGPVFYGPPKPEVAQEEYCYHCGVYHIDHSDSADVPAPGCSDYDEYNEGE